MLTCELCGGTDIIKSDGVWVCQNCGSKYSTEEVKIIMSVENVKASASNA